MTPTTRIGVFLRLRTGFQQQQRRISPTLRAHIRFQILAAFLLLYGLAGSSSYAQADAKQAPPLTLDQCVELARNAPSALKRARLQAEAARLGVRGATASFLPQLSISNTFTYNSPLLYDRSVMSFIALNGIREYTTLGTASLEVDSAGRLRAILDRARANEHIADANLAISDRDLTRNVAIAYYRVLLARRLARSAHDNFTAAQSFEDRVQKLLKGEEASKADLSKATLERALLERTAQSANLEAELANHDLASYWTSDVTTPVHLVDDLDQEPQPPLGSAGDQPFLRRPEFKLLDAQVFGYKADSRQALSKMLPQLSATFQYGIDANQLSGNNRGYAGVVHLEVPVFDWLKARSEQRQYQFQAAQVQTDKAIAIRVFSKEYQDALATVNAAYQETSTTKQEEAAAEDNLRLSRLRFDAGEGSALDVVMSQNSLVQAQIDFFSARANYLNAQSALKVASAQ